MKISVEKITGTSLMQRALSFTVRKERKPSMSLDAIYSCRHSPMRTQLFIVEMTGIPSFVSTHFVRHSAVGQQHYVGTNRDDRGGEDLGRCTPVHHMMILNAQHLIDMSHSRLCFKSHCDTTAVMGMIHNEVGKVDPALANHMKPMCLYLGRCDELKSCGFFKEIS